MTPGKLVLVVVDAMRPAMLERAVDTGQAPALQAIMERGHWVPDCVSAFPSVTPVCAATIATGTGPDRHDIPSMNWFLRDEKRYVEYGTSFKASQAFGFKQSLTDTVYNMNGAHLAPGAPTVFESLDDAGVRTAGTTYLMYRGRHEHQPAKEFATTRFVSSTVFNKPVLGPREFFYADLFASRKTGCWSQLGMPGNRDQHTGCVGAHLVEHDLFDFLLLSLPDVDTHSHKHGPGAQVPAIAEADRQLERVMHAAGGPDRFLDEHAVVVCSDHGQSLVEREVDLHDLFASWAVLPASGEERRRRGPADIALCPSSRSAWIYVLDDERRAELVSRAVRTALRAPDVDLACYLADGRAVVAAARGELRFAPGGPVRDLRDGTWAVDGDFGLLGLADDGTGRVRSAEYPDALARVWSALHCAQGGEVLLSAAPGAEFVDWGGATHVGGGSHGSLHAVDSHAALAFSGLAETAASRDEWHLTDVAALVRGHFGLTG